MLGLKVWDQFSFGRLFKSDGFEMKAGFGWPATLDEIRGPFDF